jgi:hypothetical protein
MSRLFQQGSNSESPMCDAAERAAEALIKDSLVNNEIKKFSDPILPVRAEDFEPFLERIMKQAEASFADWPLAA